MQICKLSVVFPLLAMTLSAGPVDQAGATALRIISRDVKGVKWQRSPAVADFDCDGTNDYAFLGKRGPRVVVAFRLSSRSKAQSFDFAVGKSEENSLCEEPAEIAVEPLDFDPSGGIGEVEGLELSKTCMGLQLIGGECDFFHFYWNHKRSRIAWWRL